ncbi:MAG: hypothetical protein KatS3mg008_0251 [Acidimicrobiales bacterium]|nr:MAG: hypothetical protein KatS3mg008_0251 [Acidimicrobiales bacterium]
MWLRNSIEERLGATATALLTIVYVTSKVLRWLDRRHREQARRVRLRPGEAVEIRVRAG